MTTCAILTFMANGGLKSKGFATGRGIHGIHCASGSLAIPDTPEDRETPKRPASSSMACWPPPGHQFRPDDLSLTDRLVFPALPNSKHITDFYLPGLAVKHGARFATFDPSIDSAAITFSLSSPSASTALSLAARAS